MLKSLFFLSLEDLFVGKSELQKDIEKRKWTFHLLLYSPDGLSEWGWAWLKLGASSRAATWVVVIFYSWVFSRELDWKGNIQNVNHCPFRMWVLLATAFLTVPQRWYLKSLSSNLTWGFGAGLLDWDRNSRQYSSYNIGQQYIWCEGDIWDERLGHLFIWLELLSLWADIFLNKSYINEQGEWLDF